MASTQLQPVARSVNRASRLRSTTTKLHPDYLGLCEKVAGAPEEIPLRTLLAETLEQSEPHSESKRDRAVFIKIQCQLPTLEAQASESRAFRMQARALLEKHTKSPYWMPARKTPLEPRVVSRWDFRLGCVESIELRPSKKISAYSALADFNPLRHLQLDEAPENATQLLTKKPLFPHLAGLQLRDCGIDDGWIAKFVQLAWSRNLRWLSLSRNRAITLDGVKTLAMQLPDLCYVELHGIDANPIADDDGFLPRSGCNLEQWAGRRIPWLHHDWWIEGTIPPTTIQLLDQLKRRSNHNQ